MTDYLLDHEPEGNLPPLSHSLQAFCLKNERSNWHSYIKLLILKMGRITIEGRSAATAQGCGNVATSLWWVWGCCCTMETEGHCCTMGTDGHCHAMRRKGHCCTMGFGMMLCHERKGCCYMWGQGEGHMTCETHSRQPTRLICITSVTSFNCKTSIRATVKQKHGTQELRV